MSDLRDSVVNILVSDHDFTIEEAETVAVESINTSPDLWNENVDPTDLARYLAEEADTE